MSEEFILEACKSFQRRVDIITEKNGGHIKSIYGFVSIFLSCCLFFKIKINLAYKSLLLLS